MTRLTSKLAACTCAVALSLSLAGCGAVPGGTKPSDVVMGWWDGGKSPYEGLRNNLMSGNDPRTFLIETIKGYGFTKEEAEVALAEIKDGIEGVSSPKAKVMTDAEFDREYGGSFVRYQVMRIAVGSDGGGKPNIGPGFKAIARVDSWGGTGIVLLQLSKTGSKVVEMRGVYDVNRSGEFRPSQSRGGERNDKTGGTRIVQGRNGLSFTVIEPAPAPAPLPPPAVKPAASVRATPTVKPKTSAPQAPTPTVIDLDVATPSSPVAAPAAPKTVAAKPAAPTAPTTVDLRAPVAGTTDGHVADGIDHVNDNGWKTQ